MDAKLKTFRIRSVPLGWTISQLRDFLSNDLEEAVVHDLDELYLAQEIDGETATATVQLRDNRTEYERPLPRSESEDGCPRKYLSLDSHFRGLTTLFAPPSNEHHIDIVAVHGLGGHAFGAFNFKLKDNPDHMWLRDTLPGYLKMDNIPRPAARILTYGYKSAVLESQSVQTLAEIGQGLRLSLQALMKSSDRPLILVGYSMGGLVIKEALAGVLGASDPLTKSILAQTSGILFFGCPHDGMEAQSLQLMVQGRPNQALIDSLCSDRSAMLSRLSRDFLAAVHDVCAEGDCEVFNFYETTKTPTFVPVEYPSPSEDQADQPRGEVSKRWVKSGDPIYLVKRASASHCRPANHTADNCIAIDRAHYDLVKFSRVDEDYEKVVAVLKRISTRVNRRKREQASKSQTAGEASQSHFVVPYSENERYVPRSAIIQQISSRFGHVLDGPERPARRVALYGLGGAGKTQIMLSYLYWLKRHKPSVSIFWVSGENVERFRDSYEEIARKCGIPMPDGPGHDRLELVKQWLMDSKHGEWLLALDNADDRTLFSQARGNENTQPGSRSLMSYLPDCQHGKLLITTRDKDVGRRVVKIPKDNVVLVGPMSMEESRFLLAEKVPSADTEDLDKLAEALACLPLAMVQAAAYIEQLSISITEYLGLFSEADPLKLLGRGHDLEDAEDRSNYLVSKTWLLSFDHIARRSLYAMGMLCFVSQLDRSNIPMVYLQRFIRLRMETAGRTQKPEVTAVNEESAIRLAVLESVGILQAFSLVVKQEGDMLSVHRLVHIVTRQWVHENGRVQLSLLEALTVIKERLPGTSLYARWAELLAELPHFMAVGSAPIDRSQPDPEVLSMAWTFQSMIQVQLSCILSYAGRGDDGVAWAEVARRTSTTCLEKDSEVVLQARAMLDPMLSAIPAFSDKVVRLSNLLQKGLPEAEEQNQGASPLDLDLASVIRLQHAIGDIEAADKLSSLMPMDNAESRQRAELLMRDHLLLFDSQPCSGVNSERILPVLRALSLILSHQGKLTEAEQTSRRAVDLAESTLCRWHILTLSCKLDLLNVLRRQGHYDDAVELLDQLLHDWEAHPGAESGFVKRYIRMFKSIRKVLEETLDIEARTSR